jgi:hypothetical protein
MLLDDVCDRGLRREVELGVDPRRAGARDRPRCFGEFLLESNPCKPERERDVCVGESDGLGVPLKLPKATM